MKIDYYFSVLSPFSYLGAERFLKLVTKYDLDVQEKPFDLIGEIFPNTGGLPVPKRHPARQKYRLLELDRIANKHGFIPVVDMENFPTIYNENHKIKINKQPKFFPPKDPHLPAKFTIASNLKGNKLNFGIECQKSLWSLEKDISDHNTLKEICEKLSLNFEEIKEVALSEDVNLKYQKNSKDAVDNDVFGAPTYVFNNEIFWGQDRLDYLEDALNK